MNENIKRLRDETGAKIIDCKSALDKFPTYEEAVSYLKEKGLVSAEKKSDRATNQGGIFTYVHSNNKVGVMLELNCETDFVARNDSFKELAKDLGMHLVATEFPDPTWVLHLEAVMKHRFVKDPSISVEDLIKGKITKLGENIVLKRFIKFTLGE